MFLCIIVMVFVSHVEVYRSYEFLLCHSQKTCSILGRYYHTVLLILIFVVCAYTICRCVFVQVCMWTHACLWTNTGRRSFLVIPNLRLLFYYLFEWKKWTEWHSLSKDLLRNTKQNKNTFWRTVNTHHPEATYLGLTIFGECLLGQAACLFPAAQTTE